MNSMRRRLACPGDCGGGRKEPPPTITDWSHAAPVAAWVILVIVRVCLPAAGGAGWKPEPLQAEPSWCGERGHCDVGRGARE